MAINLTYRVTREGEHLTLIAYSRMTLEAEKAAAALAESGIDCEVVDLRTLAPLDAETRALHPSVHAEAPTQAHLEAAVLQLTAALQAARAGGHGGRWRETSHRGSRR